MPRKQPRKQRKNKTYDEWLDTVVSELKKRFYLHAWRIRVLQVKECKIKEDYETIASMGSDFKYMDATLRLFPLAKKKFNEGKASSLGQDIVHEFAHILTDPLYKLAANAVTNMTGQFLEETRERSTQETAVIIWSLLPQKIFSPYKME